MDLKPENFPDTEEFKQITFWLLNCSPPEQWFCVLAAADLLELSWTFVFNITFEFCEESQLVIVIVVFLVIFNKS